MSELRNTPEPEPKRRWYQYSLRSLLIVMVLFCFLFAWSGYKVREAEKQKEVVAWVKENGGYVWYDYQFDANGKEIPSAQPPGPDWLRNLIGIDYFRNAEEVKFFKRTSDFELTPLNGLPFLRKVRITWAEPPNQELQKFQESVQKLQESFPKCEIAHTYVGATVWPYIKTWCKQCNDWHRDDSNPHTIWCTQCNDWQDKAPHPHSAPN